MELKFQIKEQLVIIGLILKPIWKNPLINIKKKDAKVFVVCAFSCMIYSQ